MDIRKNSPTFGLSVGIELSEANRRQLWIPEGLAHGFLVMSDYADFIYKTSNYYDPGSERSLKWNDPDLAIDWPVNDGMQPKLSSKDESAESFDHFKFRLLSET